MLRVGMCNHLSPVVVNSVEGGGRRAHCLACGIIGPVCSNSSEALEAVRQIQPSQRRRSTARSKPVAHAREA